MNTSLKRNLGVVTAAGLLAGATLLAPVPASAAALTCRATMSDSTPEQYSNVYVRVRTAAGANVRTVAHYRTTNTTRTGKANGAGKASIKYYISSATAGYRVYVDVTVSKDGASRSCSTSFVPHD